MTKNIYYQRLQIHGDSTELMKRKLPGYIPLENTMAQIKFPSIITVEETSSNIGKLGRKRKKKRVQI